jgi:hypothetical protein
VARVFRDTYRAHAPLVGKDEFSDPPQRNATEAAVRQFVRRDPAASALISAPNWGNRWGGVDPPGKFSSLYRSVDFTRGGEGGIRTPDTLTSMPHFECGAFNRSATSPGRAGGKKGPEAEGAEPSDEDPGAQGADSHRTAAADGEHVAPAPQMRGSRETPGNPCDIKTL